eukprot:scaffold594_cov253-Alexandrium_tamarense.AAC.1
MGLGTFFKKKSKNKATTNTKNIDDCNNSERTMSLEDDTSDESTCSCNSECEHQSELSYEDPLHFPRRSTAAVAIPSSSQRQRHVTFIDEVKGLTPRYVVTETHYRPATSRSEYPKLYYTSKDYTKFETDANMEEMICRLEQEIQDLQHMTETGQVVEEKEERRRREELIANVARCYHLKVQ